MIRYSRFLVPFWQACLFQNIHFCFSRLNYEILSKYLHLFKEALEKTEIYQTIISDFTHSPDLQVLHHKTSDEFFVELCIC